MVESKHIILNRFFTRDVIKHLLDGRKDETYSRVVRRYVDNADHKSNGSVISEIYEILNKGYRNEYFYKNTVINKLLIGVHSVNTTTALTELAIGKSKADIVLINGKAVVYEIKTELDNLERLQTQIEDYYKAFDHVSIVTYEKNIQQVENIVNRTNKPVGIYILKKNCSISEFRKPESYKNDIDKDVLFKLLRKDEYERIIIEKYGKLPVVSQFDHYNACRRLFLRIETEEAYKTVIDQLKKRVKITKEEILRIPFELRFLIYFMNLSSNEYYRLEEVLNRTYGGI